MISPEEKEFILSHAYIPEHSIPLMVGVSGGEPFLVDHYLCFLKEDWIIVVGYPLEEDFRADALEAAFEKIKGRFRPHYASVMAPELPRALRDQSRRLERDHYYLLDLQGFRVKSDLRRTVKKASERLRVEHSNAFHPPHRRLMQAFLERVKPEDPVRKLLLQMPHYVAAAQNALVLNAWDREGRLAAFYVIDLAPRRFATYVIGCQSREPYAAGASDLLMSETVWISRDQGKQHVHLGFGVNPGIRRFKKKWGGVPDRPYEMCDLELKRPSLFDTLLSIKK